MVDKKKKSEKLTFQYNLTEARKISYFENDIENRPFKDKLKKSNVLFQLAFHVAIDNSSGTIELIVKIESYHTEDGRKEELFGIATSHKFKVKDFVKVFPPNDKNEYFIPDEVMASFLGIAVSGTRGMLVVLNTNKYYKKILLPLINPLNVIKNSKKT